jgi:hypothetical protein
MEYKTESNQLKIKYYTGIHKTSEQIIAIDKIVNYQLNTRMFGFGFDVLSIKYVDEQDLYNILELRVCNIDDWIDILSSVKNATELKKSTE